VRADRTDGQDYAGWEAALPAPGADPDLVPILVDGTVALAGADGVLDPDGPGSSPRMRGSEGETEAEAVERALEIAAHGLRLRETLAGAAGRGLTDCPGDRDGNRAPARGGRGRGMCRPRPGRQLDRPRGRPAISSG
jgi:hypothetical protein